MDTAFDNRKPLYAAYMKIRGRPGYLHFKGVVAGRSIVYCYIRKNACSAFKALLVDAAGGETQSYIETLAHRWRAGSV